MDAQISFAHFSNESDIYHNWRHLCYYAIGLFFVTIVVPLLHYGMFFDGVIYATMAKNLNLGYGTLWRPVFSESMLNPFYEHPPLAIYFQSLFFKVLGPGFGAEQVYAIVMALGQFGLIAGYWLRNHKANVLSLGLLLLLWLLIPINWSYIRNYLIATLTLFTTMASLLLLLRVDSKLGLFLQYLLGSILMVIAFFSDGPTAFFPLAIPILRRIVYKPNSIYFGFLEALLLGILIAVVFFIFFKLFPDALFNTQQFLQQQVLASIMGTREPTSLNAAGIKHFFLFIVLVKAYGIVGVFALSCMILAARMAQQPILNSILQHLKNKDFLLLLAIALIASLPVMISSRQGARYIFPSVPFYTLAMMRICFQPFATILLYYTRKPLFKYQYLVSHLFFAVLIMLLGTVNVVKYQHTHVAKVLQDIHHLSQYCASNEFCRHHRIMSLANTGVLWEISFYLARYAHTRMSVTLEEGFPYYLCFKKDPIPAGYHQVTLPLSMFSLAVTNDPLTQLKTKVTTIMQAF